ncbi:MAG: MFS transporter [Firmicutes bacterium]|nr:MFS transporter [Bacillota bacterium]
MEDLKRKQFWIVVKCCALIGSSIGLISNCIGIFYTPISQALGTGRGSVAVISTIISLSTGFSGPVVARIIKKVPINRVMTAGVIGVATCFTLFSFAPRLPYFYVLAIFLGMSSICYKNLTVSIVLRSWFGNKSASKLGLAMAMSGVVAAVMNPVLSRVILAYGYSTGFRLLALLVALIGIPCASTIRLREDAEPSKASADKKEAAERTYIAPVLLAFIFAFPFFCAGGTGMNTHFSSYAVTLGYSLSFGATVVSFQSIFNSAWKLVYGFLADRAGAVKANLIYIGFSILACVLLITLTAIPTGIILAVSIYPAIFSVTTVGMPTMIQQIAKERYAEVYATANMIQTLAYAGITSTYGVISDRAGGYIPCLMIAIAMISCCGFVCFMIGKKGNIR